MGGGGGVDGLCDGCEAAAIAWSGESDEAGVSFDDDDADAESDDMMVAAEASEAAGALQSRDGERVTAKSGRVE